MPDYVVIATWSFGRTAVQTAAPLLQAGKPALEAALAGAQVVEDDPRVHSVGYGGLADAAGTVTLDACVMDGQTLSCGAVAGLENVRHAAALARRVMEKTPHVLLVGRAPRSSPFVRVFPWKRSTRPRASPSGRRAGRSRAGTSHQPIPPPPATVTTP